MFRKPSGETVLLGEIGHVIDGFAPTNQDQQYRYDGQPAVLVQVHRVGDQKPTEIADVVRSYVEERNRHLPPSAQLSIALDRAEELRGRIDLLIRYGLTGAVLVFIVLSLFLEIRLALWVTAGIAISFLGAMLMMPAFDISINNEVAVGLTMNPGTSVEETAMRAVQILEVGLDL